MRTAVLSLLLLLPACAPRPPREERAARAARGAGDVVIGVAWPWAARREIRYAEGLRMAVDEVNAAGGVLGRRVRLAERDDRESVDEGRLVAQQFGADPDVVAVIGHLQSYVAVPAAGIYDLSGLVMLAPTATDPELTSQGYRRVFRATFTEREVGRQMAEFAAARGYRRVAICYIRNRYGRGLANAFEERGAEAGVAVVARQSYDPSDQGGSLAFGGIVREWKELEFDAVFLAGEVPSAAGFVAEARRQGLRAPILGGDAMSSDALLAAGAAAEGTTVATVFHPDEPRPEVRRFAADFRRRYGAAPDAGSALGYDAVRLLVAAMRAARSTDPDSVARALHATRAWTGVTGAFTFAPNGDLVARPIVRAVVRDGRFEYLPSPAATIARAPEPPRGKP
jgi:branched-chain amino acid transport system substrate-binding protein